MPFMTQFISRCVSVWRNATMREEKPRQPLADEEIRVIGCERGNEGAPKKRGQLKGCSKTIKSNQLVMIIVPERRAAKERGEKRNER